MDGELRRYGLDRELEVELEAVERLAPDGDQKFQRVVFKKKDDTSASLNHPFSGGQNIASVVA
jgi:hypothetical protein